MKSSIHAGSKSFAGPTTYLVLIRSATGRMDEGARELMDAAQDLGRYGWMQQDDAGCGSSVPHNLVESICKEGGVWVIELASARRLGRQCGFDVACQLQQVMGRIMGHIRSLAAPLSSSDSSAVENGKVDANIALMKSLKAQMDALDVKQVLHMSHQARTHA